MTTSIFFAAALCVMGVSPLQEPRATIVIVPGDAPGEGLLDPTPVEPIGGNNGTTLGEQRRLLIQHAANAWAESLDGLVTITMVVTMDPLTCDDVNAEPGSAIPTEWFHDFENAPAPDTAYPAALANRLAGRDLNPDLPEIRAVFNSALNGDAACNNGVGWYYGFDNAPSADQLDFKPFVLHELAHALGFVASVSDTGAWVTGRPSALGRLLFDNVTGKSFADMTDAERLTASSAGRRVVFTGAATTAAAPDALTQGTPLLRIDAPASAARRIRVGTASFGPQVTASGVSGELVYPSDLNDQKTGCSFLGDDAAGRVVLIDRGGECGFTVKVKNAQDAGALAVVIADTSDIADPQGMGGEDATITIPSVIISRAEGTALKSAIAAGTTSVTVLADTSWLNGADEQNRMYVLTGVTSKVNLEHFDSRAEPATLLSLPSRVRDYKGGPNALAVAVMRDLGWTPIASEEQSEAADDEDDDDGCAATQHASPLLGLLLFGGLCRRIHRRHEQ